MTYSNNEMKSENEIEKSYRHFELKHIQPGMESYQKMVRVDKDWDAELQNFSKNDKERILRQALKLLEQNTDHTGLHIARIYQINDNYTIWYNAVTYMNSVNDKDTLSPAAYNKKLRACTELETNDVLVQNYVYWEKSPIKRRIQYCNMPSALRAKEAALIKYPVDDINIKEVKRSTKLLTIFGYQPEFDNERWRLEEFTKDIHPLNRYLDQSRGMNLLGVKNLNQDLQAYIKNYYSSKEIILNEIDEMHEKLEPSTEISSIAEHSIQPFKLELKDKLANLEDEIEDEHQAIADKIENYRAELKDRAISFAHRDDHYQAKLDDIIQELYDKLLDAINLAIKKFANENLQKIGYSKHPQSDMDALIKKYRSIFVLNTDPNYDYKIDLTNKGTMIKLVNFINQMPENDRLRKMVFENMAPVALGSNTILQIDAGNLKYLPTQQLIEKLISDSHEVEIIAKNEELMAQTKLSSDVKTHRLTITQAVDKVYDLQTRLSTIFKDINSFNSVVQLDIEKMLTNVTEAKANYTGNTGDEKIDALFVEMKADISAINLLRVVEIAKKEKALYEKIKKTPRVDQALEYVQQFEQELLSSKQTIEAIQKKLHHSVITLHERLGSDLQKRQEEFYEQLRSLIMDNLHFWEKRVKYGAFGKHITATNNEAFKVPTVIAEMHDYFIMHPSNTSASKNLKNLIAHISLKDFGTTDKAKEFFALLLELKNLNAGDFNDLRKVEPIIKKFAKFEENYGAKFTEARVAAKSRMRFSARINEREEPLKESEHSNSRSTFPRHTK